MTRYILSILLVMSMANVVAWAESDDDIYNRIARISYMEGNVSFQHTSDVDWSAASINLPLQPGDRIYTGCYMDFGYWSRDSFGTLNYVSLIPQLDQKLQDDELIWHILELNEWVIFQASHNIYFYNTRLITYWIQDISGIQLSA